MAILSGPYQSVGKSPSCSPFQLLDKVWTEMAPELQHYSTGTFQCQEQKDQVSRPVDFIPTAACSQHGAEELTAGSSHRTSGFGPWVVPRALLCDILSPGLTVY